MEWLWTFPHEVEMYGHSSTNIAYKFLDIQYILRPQTSLEVGAYDGWYSKKMRNINPTCEVIAFEGNPNVIESFKESYHGIDLRNLAISDKTGEIDFFMGGGMDGSNGIKQHREWIGRKPIKVPSSTLDIQAEGKNHIAIWMDVEGANKEVLVGAKNILKNVDSMLIEVETTDYWEDQWVKDDVVEYLDAYNLVPLAEEGQYDSCSNMIFIRKELINKEIKQLFRNFFTKTYFYL